jgi:hypothetical protein
VPSAGALHTADPVAALLSWLRGHAGVTAALGDAAHISGRNEPPYPRLLIAPSAGGDDLALRWVLTGEVGLSTLGALDGTPGQAELRRLHYTALAAAAELPASTFGPADPVVSAVRPSSPARFAPEPLTGQPAWRSTLLLTMHPATAVP